MSITTVKPVYSDHLVVLIGRWSLYRGQNQLLGHKQAVFIERWSLRLYCITINVMTATNKTRLLLLLLPKIAYVLLV